MGHLHFMAPLLQEQRQRLRRVLVVFDDQHVPRGRFPRLVPGTRRCDGFMQVNLKSHVIEFEPVPVPDWLVILNGLAVQKGSIP